MYVSRITLKQDASNKPVFWKKFNNEYSLHQAIWELFADNPDRRRDFLYRIDKIGKNAVIYAVSARLPKDKNNLWAIEQKPYEPQIKTGAQLGFILTVSPVCKRDGKRHDVVMDEKYKIRKEASGNKNIESLADIVQKECFRWLKERSEKNGFSIIDGDVRADGYRQHKYFKENKKGFIQYSTVDYTGVLEVTDNAKFKDILFNGLGPEKSFGCGLFLIRRI